MKNIFVILLALAGTAQAQRPAVGEAEYDRTGRLLRADPPCQCGPGCDCGPGCRCPVHGTIRASDSHVRYRNQTEQKAFLIWIWNRRNPEQKQQPTDPAVVAMLQQLQASNQRLTDLVAQLNNAPRQSPQIILIPQGQPYQYLPVEPKPRQDLPVEPKPRQDLPVEPKPRQDLPVEPKPKQDLPVEPKPRDPLPLDRGPRQSLPGEGKPFTAPPGQAKPAPAGYQQYSRQPVLTRAIYYPRER